MLDHDLATASSSPVRARHAALATLAESGVDVLIVGGGITGAGIARDAALRGLRVLIVDKGDWASGTSSRSSKLVHGGLRYLENYQFGLVMESTRERYRQQQLNPNLVFPTPFLMPVYAGSQHGLFKLNLGLWLYDLLALFRAHRVHRKIKPAEARRVAPGLRLEGLRGALHYFDCRTDDARLTLANVLDAERHGATALNYARFVAPQFADGRVVSATIEDTVLGHTHTIPCRHLVYATGPWSNAVPEAPRDGHLVRPTKGVHVVVPFERLPLQAAVTMAAVRDGRVMFAIPFDHATYLGTTDTDFDGDADAVHATDDDVAYILETANHYFPEAGLDLADIQSTWAGLRPLIRDDAATAYTTSREHEILPDPRGITTIAGGKLTTYRAMASELLKHVLKDLRRHHGVKARRCTTHKVPLDPNLPRTGDPVFGPEDPAERALWRVHGSDLAWVRERAAAHPAEAALLSPGLPYLLAEVSWAVLGEQALRLEDVLIRRLPIFYVDPDQGLGCAPLVAEHMAALLGRDRRWVDDELAAYRAEVTASRAWRGPASTSAPAPLAEAG